jgi:archaeosortase A (PGF-CTERM-specific)
MVGVLSDSLAWAVVLAFAAGALVSRHDRERGRLVTAGAWALFGVFWLQLVPHFAFEQKSYIEGVLSAAAVPASLYTGYLLYDGRDSLFTLSRAVAAMGIIYLPFETIPAMTLAGVSVPAPRKVLIDVVTAQTHWLINALGYQPELVRGDAGYLNTFLFVLPDGHRIEFSLVLACTGLGSIAVFAGLIAAVEAPFERKARALALAVPVIYALNLLRTTFIAVVFGKQYMQWAVDTVLLLFGSSDPYMVSFFLSDRVISQSLAVVALVGIIYLVVRQLPELLTVVEDVLYLVTREEYDLAEALDLPREPTNRVVPDGGED